MLCYVFQEEGKLLCYFDIHERLAENGSGNDVPTLLHDDAAECQKRQKELLQSMIPVDRKRFLRFCRGKRSHRWLCGFMEHESLVLCSQEQNVALYAERYDRTMSSCYTQDGMLLQLIDQGILRQLNERYDRSTALIMTLRQPKPLGETGEKDAILEKVTGIVQYLVTCKEQVWEGGVSDPNVPCRRFYQKDRDGSLVAEALDLQDLLLFLKKELPSLPLFDGIRILGETALHKLAGIRVRCSMSAFVCLYVLLTYYVGAVSLHNVSDVTVELDTTHAHVHIGGLINGQGIPLCAQDDFGPLRELVSQGQSILWLAEYLLRQQRISYGCQIQMHDTQTQRLELYLSLPILSPSEVVFRHTRNEDAWARTLQAAELVLFLLWQDGTQGKNATEKPPLQRP